MKNKKLIVWSGGFDSTALIIKAIQECEMFDVMYIKMENNEIKSRIELYTRTKIKEMLSPFIDNTNDIMPVSLSIFNTPMLSQPVVWSFGLSLYLAHFLTNQRIFDYSQVEMGYIKGDCFWHISEQFKNTYYSLLSMSQLDKENIPKLVYPFEWDTKQDLYNRIYSLNSKYIKIMNLTWTCENPKLYREYYEECGVCETCRNRIEFKNKNSLVDCFNIKIPEKVLGNKLESPILTKG